MSCIKSSIMQIELIDDVIYRDGDRDRLLPQGTQLQVLTTLVQDGFYFVCVLPNGFVKYISSSKGRVIDPSILESQKEAAREVAVRVFTDMVNSTGMISSPTYLALAREYARKAHEVAMVFMSESLELEGGSVE